MLTLFLSLALCQTQPDSADAYLARLEFSHKLSHVRIGEPEASVQELLGRPPSAEDVGSDPPGLKAWYYARKGYEYPELGTVFFDSKGQVAQVFGGTVPSPAIAHLPLDLDRMIDRIGECRGFSYQEFSAQTELHVANELLGLGRQNALLLLDEFVRIRPIYSYNFQMGLGVVGSHSVSSNDGRLALLILTMLGGRYPAKLNPENGYVYIGMFGKQPLAFVDEVPYVNSCAVMMQLSSSYDGYVLDYLRSLDAWPKSAPTPLKDFSASYSDAISDIRTSGAKSAPLKIFCILASNMQREFLEPDRGNVTKLRD